MEEDPLEKLADSIRSAFDKWSYQYYKKRIDKKGRISKKLKEEMRYEDLFLSKRVFVLGFSRFVTSEVNSSPTCQKQKLVVLRAILQSIINEEGITIKELEKETGDDELYTRRHTQRIIHEIFGEAFVDTENLHKDERLRAYSSVFSPHMEVERPEIDPEEYIDVIGGIPMTPRNIKWIEINSRVRTVTPEYLTEYLEFKEQALALMKELGYQTEMGMLLYNQLSNISEIQQVFYNHFQSILAVTWWRSRRQDTKKKLIDDGFPWKYTDKDAKLAKDYLFELSNSREHTFNVMFDSAVAMIETNLKNSSESVFKEIVTLDVGLPFLRGLAHENVGVFHRENKRPKLMIQEMKKAVEWYKESENLYRLAVGYKNLAEAEWMYGLQDTALRYYNESEKIADTLPQEDMANVYGNLAVSAMRINNKEMEKKYLLKYIMTCPEDWTERILNADRRLSEIS